MNLQVYKLPTDRFYATYFGGDEKAGLAPDTESRDMWLEFLPAERVLPFGCKVSLRYNFSLFFALSSYKYLVICLKSESSIKDMLNPSFLYAADALIIKGNKNIVHNCVYPFFVCSIHVSS